MWIPYILFSFTLMSTSARAVTEPVGIAAEYYFSRQDYKQAASLWNEVYRRHPENVSALFRVCELKLLLESRAGCRDLMLKFLSSSPHLNSEMKRQVREKHSQLQALFLSDEGQANFLQAMSRVGRKDFGGALPLLDSSLTAEQGNVKVLWERAKVEKKLQRYDRYFETLKEAAVNDPFHAPVKESLIDAYLYYRQFDKAVALYQTDPDSFSGSARTGVALALLETGAESQAQSMFLAISEQDKQRGVNPIVWYGLGRILKKKGEGQSPAGFYFERFINAVAHPQPTAAPPPWDPYHTEERLEEVRKLLKS